MDSTGATQRERQGKRQAKLRICAGVTHNQTDTCSSEQNCTWDQAESTEHFRCQTHRTTAS